jgi:hypothetical protein
VFWWPFTGLGFDDDPFPITDRGVISVGLEAIGIGLCVWLWRTNEFSQAGRRATFRQTGALIAAPQR